MAPADLKNLTGKYRMAKDSSDVTPVLALQGFGRMMRYAMSKAPVYISITQPIPSGSNNVGPAPSTEPENSVQIQQTTTASIPGVTEQWSHDWEWREFDDKLFKRIRSRSRWVKARDVQDHGDGRDWLIEDLDPESDVVECDNGPPDESWMAHQVWRIDEKGRFVRRVVTRKGGEKVQMLLIYEAEK